MKLSGQSLFYCRYLFYDIRWNNQTNNVECGAVFIVEIVSLSYNETTLVQESFRLPLQSNCQLWENFILSLLANNAC
jgi:hypothetical protein